MGIDRYVYAANDTTWVATFMERIEKQSKGYNAVSLSNYDATGVCVITDGSAFEVAGSMYLCTTDTSITGSPATGLMYIMATGATATASVAWSTAAPVWRDELQGYFASAASVVRTLGAVYFDGSSYLLKTVYKDIEHTLVSKALQIPLAGHTVDEDNVALYVTHCAINTANSNTGAYVPVYLPQDSIVTNLYSYCQAHTTGTAAVELSYSPRTVVTRTAMATTNHSATGAQNDTTITGPQIDNDTNVYRIGIARTASTANMVISGVEVTAIIRKGTEDAF